MLSIYLSGHRTNDPTSHASLSLTSKVPPPPMFLFLNHLLTFCPSHTAMTPEENSVDVKEGRIPQVSYSCSPEILSLCKGMQPQLFLSYGSSGNLPFPWYILFFSHLCFPAVLSPSLVSDRIALLDAYNLLSYATETSSCTSVEKERMSALWRDLFRVIFNMPIHFLFTASSVDKLQQHYHASVIAAAASAAAVAPSASSSGAAAGSGDGPSQPHTKSSRTTRHDTQQQLHQQHAPSSSTHVFWPVGTRVVTVYGTGTVMAINKTTGIHEVSLSRLPSFCSSLRCPHGLVSPLPSYFVSALALSDSGQSRVWSRILLCCHHRWSRISFQQRSGCLPLSPPPISFACFPPPPPSPLTCDRLSECIEMRRLVQR
jgi:hypothetical protein